MKDLKLDSSGDFTLKADLRFVLGEHEFPATGLSFSLPRGMKDGNRFTTQDFLGHAMRCLSRMVADEFNRIANKLADQERVTARASEAADPLKVRADGAPDEALKKERQDELAAIIRTLPSFRDSVPPAASAVEQLPSAIGY